MSGRELSEGDVKFARSAEVVVIIGIFKNSIQRRIIVVLQEITLIFLPTCLFSSPLLDLFCLRGFGATSGFPN